MQRVAWVVWACLLSPSCAAQLEDATSAALESSDDDALAGAETHVSGVETAVAPSQPMSAIAAAPAILPEAPDEAPPDAVPDDVTPPEASPMPAPEPLCEQANWPGLADLHLTQPAQYVALRVRGESRDELETVELASFGSRCVNAADPVECEIDLVNAQDTLVYETTVCDPVCKQYFLVTAFEGALHTWGSGSAVRALLGAVDTPGEAVLLAFYSVKGIDLGCAAADPSLVKAVRGGYELPVRLRRDDACSTTEELGSVRVESNGRVELTRTGERTMDVRACP